ncbi:MAG: hypothetical protein FJ290_03735 [Planctomycetes bacterium]|nr:hypothetical protein [Planctomycetota bacterium]
MKENLPHSGVLHRGRFSEPGAAYFVTKCRWDVGPRHAALKALEFGGHSRSALGAQGSAGRGGPAHSEAPVKGAGHGGPAHSEAPVKGAGRGGPAHSEAPVKGAGHGGPAHICFTEPSAAEVIVSSIRWHQERGFAHLLGFVVMPDHVHWVFVLGERRALDDVMRGFGSVTWQGFRRAYEAGIGRVWEEDYHEHRLRSDERCWATIEYVHQNPVRKGLCAKAEDWPWTTANPRFRDWVEDDYLR